MNTTPVELSLTYDTINKLAGLIDVRTLTNVIRFDCVMGTIDASNRNVERDGIIYDEVRARLGLAGTGHLVERIFQACLYYQSDVEDYAEEIHPLEKYLAEWVGYQKTA